MVDSNRTRAHIRFIVGVIMVAACTGVARGQTDRVPPSTLAWWRYDPTAFPQASTDAPPGSERAVLLATLRAALASGTLGRKTGAMIGSLLLVGLEAGDTPHTLALIDFQASRPPDGTGIDIHELQVAMRLDTGDRHADVLRTVRAVAIDAFPGEDGGTDTQGVQARIALPGGRTGVAFRKADWESWREIAWCSEADAFTIGIGRSALDDWFSADAPTDDAPEAPWAEMRHAIDAARPSAPIVFECYIDFSALQHKFPQAFQIGRTPRMLAALDLGDAQALLFQARVVEADLPDQRRVALMAIDAAVRNIDGEISHRVFSYHAWPDTVDPAVLPPGATSATVATVNWSRAFDLVVAMHAATISDRKLREFEDKRDTWLEANRPALDSLIGEFQPALVIATHDGIPAPLPGVGCVLIPAKAGAPTGRIAAQMEAVLAGFHPGVRTTTSKTTPSPVWSLRVDRTGLVRLPWWTLVRTPPHPDVLVGAWAASPLEAVRRWLGGEAPP